MTTSTLWIVRVVLMVQILGVLAVPGILARDLSAEAGMQADSPRAIWMADWQRPGVAERTIGVLRITDGILQFEEQLGLVDWKLDLEDVKRVAVVNGGRSLSIVSVSGEEYVLTILNPSLMQIQPKRVAERITRGIETLAANAR